MDDAFPSLLIGRHLELELLTDGLKRARGGRAGLMLIRGAPGVGKTRLLAAAAGQARLLGFRVLQGRADELERGVAYAALRDALGAALALEENPLLEGMVAEVKRSLLTPGQRALEPDDATSPDAFAAGEQLLRAWADREPVLLAIDDLHAADDDTLAVMSLLARTLRDTRVLLLATLRPDPPDLGVELGALVERLAGRPDVVVIDVDPLDDDDVIAFVTSTTGATPEDSFARVLVDLTRGNIFYLEEILRSYRDAGAIEVVNGRSQLTGDAPAVSISTRSAVLHRVFSLGRDERAVARVLTAFQRFELDRLDLVAELAGIDIDAVERAFDALVRARILSPVGDAGFEFAHPIVRATLDEDLGPAERRRIHGALAARLCTDRKAGRDVDVLELATHVAEAATPGDAAAGAILAEAGDLSAVRAPRSAADWYRRALAVLPAGDASRGRVLGRRARALFLAQRKTEAAEVARQAVTLLPAGPDRERAAVVLASSLRALGRLEEALAVTDDLLDPGAGESAMLLAERASLLVQLDRFVEAEETAGRAVDLAHDLRGATLARTALAQAAYAQGDVRRGLAILDKAVEAADLIPTLSAISVLLARASYLAYSGWITDAGAALEEVQTKLVGLGGDAFRTSFDPPAVWVLGLSGRWDEALEQARSASLEFERSGELFLLALLRTMEAWILLERGAVRGAADILRTVNDTPSARSVAAWVGAGVHLALAQPGEARKVLVAAIETDQRTGRRSVLPLLLERLVEVEDAAGDAGAVASALIKLEAATALVRTPWARCLLLRAEARVRRDPEPARRSAAEARGAGLRFEAARSTLLAGSLDPDGTDELLDAHDELRALGAEPWRRKAAHLLRSRGRAVPRQRSSNEGGLTTTDRQLARLVTEGMTNRQIAGALFLSAKTVEVYLSRLYVKVGCSSRTELAVAVKSGLVPLDEASDGRQE